MIAQHSKKDTAGRAPLTAGNEQAFFTIAEIAQRWRCSEKKVRRSISAGELVTHKFGALLRVSAKDLLTYERFRRAP